jgi:hydrogenase maturation protease
LTTKRKLLLACGNPLRGDDGVGGRIAEALERDGGFSDLRIEVSHQFTPELAECVRDAELVVFVDASALIAAGQIKLEQMEVEGETARAFTHHLTPASLMALTQALYSVQPKRAYALSVGASNFELGQRLSATVEGTIPEVVERLRVVFAEPLNG